MKKRINLLYKSLPCKATKKLGISQGPEERDLSRCPFFLCTRQLMFVASLTLIKCTTGQTTVGSSILQASCLVQKALRSEVFPSGNSLSTKNDLRVITMINMAFKVNIKIKKAIHLIIGFTKIARQIY